jgi:hypothetical protein
VAATADGGFLIADTFNQRVRRVSPAGTITTVAGTTEGLSGDGRPATAAPLNFPSGGGGDPDGGFLIADQENQRVRLVDADLRGPARSGVRPARARTRHRPPARPPAQRVRLRYATTTAATIELRVLSGSRRVALELANTHAGRNTIRLRAPGRARRYRVQLIGTTRDGQTATDRARPDHSAGRARSVRSATSSRRPLSPPILPIRNGDAATEASFGESVGFVWLRSSVQTSTRRLLRTMSGSTG